MCNLYSQTKAREAMIRMFRVSDNRAAAFTPQPAIFPGHEAPVVRLADDGEREVAILSWGFVLPQKGRAAKRVTNARADKVRTSSFWRGSFDARRCLVPVTSFAEPKGKRPAVWHWFGLKGDEARPLFAFAGLWRSWRGPLKPDAAPVAMDVYAFLTTRPNDVVKPIHPARMPVLLSGQDQFDSWLEGTADEAHRLARPFPASAMDIVHTGEKQDAA
jgi:putative SOS response-associated peptidase YedK